MEPPADASSDSDTDAAPAEAKGQPIERDPDVRFSYANERTFLAWNRTALALVTAGLAITQLLPPTAVPGGRKIIGLPLIVVGTVIAVASLRQWQLNEKAMRRGQPLPASQLPRLVSIVIAVCAVVALVVATLGAET